MKRKPPEGPDLFSYFPHARTGDPATSHEAVPTPKVMSAQCVKVLRIYAYPAFAIMGLIDHDAYRHAGLNVEMNGARQRCTDLRSAKLIEWTGGRGRTPSDKSAGLCRITQKGRDYLNSLLVKPDEPA